MRLLRALGILLLTSICSAESGGWEVPESVPFRTEEMEHVISESGKVSSSEPTGIWSFPEEDCEVAIIPLSDSDTGTYKIVLLYDADLLPPPGSVIGYLAPTASRSKWHVWLYSNIKGMEMRSPREFNATFSFSTQSEDASLVLEKPKGGMSWRINPLGLVPIMRRILSVNMKGEESKLPYGLHRKDTVHRLRWL